MHQPVEEQQEFRHCPFNKNAKTNLSYAPDATSPIGVDDDYGEEDDDEDNEDYDDGDDDGGGDDDDDPSKCRRQ